MKASQKQPQKQQPKQTQKQQPQKQTQKQQTQKQQSQKQQQKQTQNQNTQKINYNDFPIYNSILDKSNVLSTLVTNITSDELFQKHVSVLNESEKPEDVKKAQVINETIFNMRIFNTKVNPLFLAKDIGILLGIPHIKYIVRKFEAEEMVVGYIKTPNNKIKKVIFLTRHGIYRCFYVSRSPLAKLFRKFIGNLIDHMITHETEVLQKISAVFKTENPELIERGLTDLNNKVAELEVKYIEEKKRAEELLLQCEDEQKKRAELEQENTEIDIANSYNMMYIEQLKQDKIKYSEKIRNMNDSLLEDNSTDTLEIKLIKEKYMKPIYIYILHPNYFNNLLHRWQSTNSGNLAASPNVTATFSNPPEADSLQEFEDEIIKGPINADNHQEKQNAAADIQRMIGDIPDYKKNYENIFTDKIGDEQTIKIEKDEILYFYINFSRNVAKKDKIIYIESQWVANKLHFSKLLKSLAEHCSVLTFNKLTLFKTSLDEIHDIIREEFITL
jgi:prophage antirepressor-like protein